MTDRMVDSKSSRFFRIGIFGAFTALVLFTVIQSRLRAAESGLLQAPSKSLVMLNLKFDGAGSCKSPSCHGSASAADAPARGGNEFTAWNSDDKHHTAYKTLSSAKSKAIAAACGIADATKSTECLGCHSLDVPAPLQGNAYKVSEGVTCNSCHGPSQKWLGTHTKTGWLAAQRKAIPDHETLLQTDGIFDTKPLLARADRCTSCHLAIDAKLIKAQHPQPLFEIAYFSDSEPKHWRDPDGLFVTKLWAVGQAVCLRDAALQVADRLGGNADKAQLDEAIAQTRSHYEMLERALAVIDAPRAASLKVAGATFSSTPVAATALSSMAAKIAQTMEKTDFTAPQTLAILKSIAAANLKSLGNTGQLQQAEGMSELYTAYATATSLSDDAASDAFSKLPPPADSPGGKLDPAYDANLKTAKSHMPK